MDGVLMDGRSGRLWMCKKEGGHVLGLQLQVQEGGFKIDKLLEFRFSVSVGETKENKTVCLPEVDISGVVVGTKEDICCTICESKRTWFIGEAALERFLKKRSLRKSKLENVLT